MSSGTQILYEVRQQIAHITINRPESSNAISLEGGSKIRLFLDQAESDNFVRAIVLAASGSKVFSAGADLQELKPTRHNAYTAKTYDTEFDKTLLSLERCKKPTIAKINGHVIGGSLALIMGCDIRVAANAAKFRIPVAHLGFLYTPTQVKRIINSIGVSKTKLLIFTADGINANIAYSWGLIDIILDDDDFEAQFEEFLISLSKGQVKTQMTMKHLINNLDLFGVSDEKEINKLYEDIYGLSE